MFWLPAMFPFSNSVLCLQVLVSSVGLSFWGGVSPKTGAIIDRHHPLHGCSLRDKILVLPGGRGAQSNRS